MWRHMSLMAGFMVALTLVVAGVAFGSLWIWQNSIREQVEALRSERFRFSLMEVRAGLEAGLRLGNTTVDLTGTEDIIAQVRNRQPDILSIDVFDAQTDVLFSTDQGAKGRKLPPAWAVPCQRPDAASWRGRDLDGGVQCVSLVNAFGEPAGGILLRHRLSERTVAGLSLPANWPALAAWVAALMFAATWAAVWMVDPLQKRARALREALHSGQTTLPSSVAETCETFGPAAAAVGAMQAHEVWLQETDAEADRLDRQEAV